MFTLAGGGPWMCVTPESEWPTEDPEIIAAIKTDFEGTWGDREYRVVVRLRMGADAIRSSRRLVTIYDLALIGQDSISGEKATCC